MDLLCIEADVFSVVNIRLDLRNHAYTKSQRKIKRLVEQRFTIAIGPAKVSQSRQRLYDGQKSRFKGFIHESLDEYLHAGFHNTVFDTQEVCVYDSDRLIAVSFFDLGERSMASLLALYDPEYESYSLGTYTMLKEIEFGKQTGRTWYYPGYVLDQPSAFDYKLRLGPMEYYTPSKRWGKFENFDRSETVAFTLRSAMSQLIQRLNDDGIEMKEWFYPYFSMGYMPLWKDRFLHLPWIVELGHDLDGMCAVGFCAERKRFLFVHIHPCPDEQHFINMEQAREFGDHTTYLSHLMEYGLPVAEGDLATILPFIENWQTRPDKIAPV